MTQRTLTYWRRRGRHAGFLLLACSTFAMNGIAAARTGLPALPEPAQAIDFTAPQVAARVHLDHFFHYVLDDFGVAQKGAAVRVALPTTEGRQRLVWLTPFIAQDGGYLGADDTTGSGENSGLIPFERSQVVDWSFIGEDGRLFGNFTTRLMLHTLQAERAAEIAALLSESPAPREWYQ